LVAVQFPTRATVAGRGSGAKAGDVSADGLWREETSCPTDTSCYFDFYAVDGTQHTTVLLTDYPGWPRWSRDGHVLAFSTTPYGAPAARDIRVIDDPVHPTPRVVASADGTGIYDYAWLPDGRLLASLGGGVNDRPHLIAVNLKRTQWRLADTPDVVYYMYPSPDGGAVAFTQNSATGWRLFAYDVETGVLRDLGNMGSDPAGTQPPAPVPPGEGKGPMYIAWSPDGSKLAFGGGSSLRTSDDRRSRLGAVPETSGQLSGRIKWSPTADDWPFRAATSAHAPRVVRRRPETGVLRRALGTSSSGRPIALPGDHGEGQASPSPTSRRSTRAARAVGDTPLRWIDAE
jgi:Tol biopolymer transport system component